MDFKDRLAFILKQKKIKASELSRASGVSEASISEYLSGKKEPMGKTTIALAKGLGVSLDTLLDTEWATEEGSDMCSSLSQEAQEIGGLFDKASDDDKDVVRFALRKYKDTVAKNSNLDTKEAM